jgi:Zn-dependent metalloprotease
MRLKQNTKAAKALLYRQTPQQDIEPSQSTALSGSSYILSDATRGNGVQTYNMKKRTNYSTAVNFTDSDNNWTTELNNANKDNAALDAHWGAEKHTTIFRSSWKKQLR